VRERALVAARLGPPHSPGPAPNPALAYAINGSVTWGRALALQIGARKQA